MQFTETNNRYLIRLEKGEEIIKSLTAFCSQNTIKSGELWAIGAVLSAEIGFYHLDKKNYSFKQFNTPHEIASLIGNVALVDGKPFLHIHTVLADENFACVGGHLKEATVGATCEVYLTNLDTEINRKFDEEIGLKLLDCKAIP
ncbi:hypothetical protein A3A54_01865 [Candidatus Curtissbacteria bacterium RIFCSPLOWO2_01_FULL_39_62]|uniref:PPC domain-containing protein n=2 Tax=Candidatus Curtissiibacteriota TaxID=1752717 RepID=A0A1F5G977_9BACT|nr:MAG: hypothetical protein A2775_00670 [Candidatus Curtissbacteria bacterium RIFCSPHIGHO2_01_FULL_39_57]OGD88387.1 MAG: hypothetical protein A3D04_02850 [Candidatus Curtissbacteria bacterium RIFCSPHIGHO2_02_FULL_40_16b]OGD90512.1 MAG: hypothetical protein A3E11_02560 [Candidatus Curtissbacteria bacterium RIFCSPHIGHO2_12_FULL_38_37]OGD99739.1 MAG: hypothetical protein A3J17_00275 [Candidatus Curtissbacteria bacterium RIFCSPLOWO2_02_FULL_40_11]OGE00941.1 MAG: hypothetical protein A3A54_01865 [C